MGQLVRLIGALFDTVTAVAVLPYIVTDSDQVITITAGTGAVTLPALLVAPLQVDREIWIQNLGTGTATITPTGADTVNGAASFVLSPSAWIRLLGRSTGDWAVALGPIGSTRVVALADAAAITPTADTADINTQVNTQAAGAFTVNAPSGTPFNSQKLQIRIKSANVQTYAWNAIYRGSTSVPLPTVSSGTGKTDYIGFVYNTADSKWDCLATSMGYT
jgi:hypothetical protein